MRISFSRHFGVITLCCLIVGGCGSKPTEGAPAAKPTESTATAANKDSDASARGGSAWGCEQYAAGTVDMMSESASYLFIGQHPMCTDKEKAKSFCMSLRTQEGFVRVQDADEFAESAQAVAATLPEESREGYLQKHPKNELEQAASSCGTKVEEIRSKLVADVEAAMKAGDPNAHDGFLVREAPAKAEALWTSECAGRLIEKTVGEGLDWDFKGNPNYAGFCKQYASSSRPPKFKAPAAR